MSSAPANELRDAYATDRVAVYLMRLWARREYVWFVARSELRSRQMTSLLGNVWHLLNPALSIAVYFVIFGVLLDGDRGVDNYILFITVGVLFFADVQRATMAGAGAIANNRGLLQSLAFPRAMLPITSTLTESLASLPGLVVIYSVALLTSESPRITWLLLPLLLAVMGLLNLGLALIAARGSSQYADLRQVLPFLFRLLLYGSGVVFSVDVVAEGRSWAWIFDLNPVYGYLSIARWSMMGGELRWEWLVAAAVWTAIAGVGGFWWFRRAEDNYGR